MSTDWVWQSTSVIPKHLGSGGRRVKSSMPAQPENEKNILEFPLKLHEKLGSFTSVSCWSQEPFTFIFSLCLANCSSEKGFQIIWSFLRKLFFSLHQEKFELILFLKLWDAGAQTQGIEYVVTSEPHSGLFDFYLLFIV